MVHRESKIPQPPILMPLANIPFESIPQAFVEVHGEYSYSEYQEICKFLNESRVYWNLALFSRTGEWVAVCWGMWDVVEKHIRVVRVAVHPLRRSRGVLKKLLYEVRLLASSMQAKKVYWESNEYKAWLRILDGSVFTTEARVIQVY